MTKRALSLMVLTLSWQIAAMDEVDNDIRPKGKTYTIRFTEELRFGADEDDDNYLWPTINTLVDADSNGNIYVIDARESRLLMFNAEGEFQRVAIKKGQGPGEIPNLMNFQFLADGTSIGVAAGPGAFPRHHLFDKELNFVTSRGVDGVGTFPQNGIFSPDGKYFGCVYIGFNMETGSMSTRTGILDDKFEVVKQLTESQQTVDFNRFSDPNYMADFFGDSLSNVFKGIGFVTFDGEGNCFTAISNKYEITKWNADISKETVKIRRKYKPIAVKEANIRAMAQKILEPWQGVPAFRNLGSDSWLDRVVARADLPPANNPIYGLLPMEDGHMLVVHDVDMVTGHQVADIFSKDGVFLGQVEGKDWVFVGNSNTPRMRFRNGKAYTILTDEDGENRVARYGFEFVPAK